MKNKYVILILAMLIFGLATYVWFWMFGFGIVQSLIFGVLVVLIGMFK